jgi:hypothetical protein
VTPSGVAAMVVGTGLGYLLLNNRRNNFVSDGPVGPTILGTPNNGPVGPTIYGTPNNGPVGPTIYSTPNNGPVGPTIYSTPNNGPAGPTIYSTPADNGVDPGLVMLSYSEQAARKGYYGVETTPNGGPTFANTDYLYPVEPWQQNVVSIPLTGSYRADFKAANEQAGLTDYVPPGYEAPPGYVWHHVDDYESSTGRATLELVEKGAHDAVIPHRGSVSQYEEYNDVTYKR